MKLKNNIRNFSFLLVLIICNCSSRADNVKIKAEIRERVTDKISFLNNNFRYKLLNYYKKNLSTGFLDSMFFYLRSEPSLDKINGKLLSITSTLPMSPILIEEGDDVEMVLLLNELLILDELIFQS